MKGLLRLKPQHVVGGRPHTTPTLLTNPHWYKSTLKHTHRIGLKVPSLIVHVELQNAYKICNYALAHTLSLLSRACGTLYHTQPTHTHTPTIYTRLRAHVISQRTPQLDKVNTSPRALYKGVAGSCFCHANSEPRDLLHASFTLLVKLDENVGRLGMVEFRCRWFCWFGYHWCARLHKSILISVSWHSSFYSSIAIDLCYFSHIEN